MTRSAALLSIAGYLPEREVSNEDLKARLPEHARAVDEMEQATGIRRRFWAPESWAASDLAVEAARAALERSGTEPEEVDLIVVGTDSPDYVTPATSVVVQHKLGAKHAGTYDVGCACASFPTGLATAAGMMAVEPSLRRVLVIGVYLMHKLADPRDPALFFYGDGAGAAVLGPSDAPGFLAAAFRADGSYHRHWGIYAGATAEPATEEAVRAGRTQVRFVERYPPEVNHEGWPDLVRRLGRNAGFTPKDLDLVIFTQVRKPSVEHVMDLLGLSMDRTHTIMEEQGYTGSACVPMALADAVAEGKVRRGNLLALVGSGVGYNQAAVAFRVTDAFAGARA